MDSVPRCLAEEKMEDETRTIVPEWNLLWKSIVYWTKVDARAKALRRLVDGRRSEATETANERGWIQGSGERVCEFRCLSRVITTRYFLKQVRQLCGCWNGLDIRSTFRRARRAAGRCIGIRAIKRKRCHCLGGSSSSSRGRTR